MRNKNGGNLNPETIIFAVIFSLVLGYGFAVWDFKRETDSLADYGLFHFEARGY